MAKMRIVQPRVTQEETSSDLRGLGDAEIFNQSAPQACLALGAGEGGKGRPWLSSLLEAYGLRSEETSEGMHLIRASKVRDGEHKLQALTLFFAAMEIAHRDSTAHLALMQVSPLHTSIEDGARRGGRQTDGGLVHHAQKALLEASPLHLDAAVVGHIRQAGIQVGFGEGEVQLSRQNLAEIQQGLSEETHIAQTHRKVG